MALRRPDSTPASGDFYSGVFEDFSFGIDKEWAWLLTAHNQVFDFIVGATVQGAVYGAIGGVIAAIDPYIGLLMLTMGVAEAIHWLFSTYTEPGDQICATVAGAGGAIVGIATSWTFTTGWDNWSNGRGRPGLGGEGPDGRPNNTGGGPELGGGPNDGSGGPYDPPSGGTPGDEGNPEWPTGGGLDDSDQHPTNGGLDDTEQQPTGGGDDGRPGLGGVGNHFCSFSEDTPVATEDGETPIGDLELGDKVMAYNEETGELEYQEVTAVWEHYDDVLLLTLDGETLETTTDHPFYTDEGEWVAAGDLEIGVHIRKSDGTYGEVEAIEQTETTQPMFNLTVDEVHTYFVGDEQWLVHNWCYHSTSEIRYTQNTASPRGNGYTVEGNIQLLRDNPDAELPAIRVFRKTAAMDTMEGWEGFTNERGLWASPENLENGQMYSIDNRRLAAYRAAGRERIPVEILDTNNQQHLDLIRSKIDHFTTNNYGTSILIDGGIYD